jgi:hypothetical protein
LIRIDDRELISASVVELDTENRRQCAVHFLIASCQRGRIAIVTGAALEVLRREGTKLDELPSPSVPTQAPARMNGHWTLPSPLGRRRGDEGD